MTAAVTEDQNARRAPSPVWGHSGGRRIEVWLIVAFWGIVALLTIIQRTLDMRSGALRVPPPGEVLQILIIYTFWAVLTPGVFWLCRRFGMEGRAWVGSLIVHLLAAACVVVLVSGLDYWSFQALGLARRGPHPVPSFTRLFFSFFFLKELFIYLVVVAAGFARNYFRRYQVHSREAVELRTHAAELQVQLAEARLHTLRMQVNPHFLFNTLHAVAALVERDPRGVRRMIARLSELLRYALDEGTPQEISLEQEMKFIRGYLEIQQIRFQGKLEVQQEIEPAAQDALLPNLILQPLVENAVKHGTSRSVGEGRILIRGRREGDMLVVSVHDNGPGPAPSHGDGAPSTSQGIGLRNTRERLESLYGDEGRMTLAPDVDGGCVAQIEVPFHTQADLRTVAVQVGN